jgi:hypothetical protein
LKERAKTILALGISLVCGDFGQPGRFGIILGNTSSIHIKDGEIGCGLSVALLIRLEELNPRRIKIFRRQDLRSADTIPKSPSRQCARNELDRDVRD